MPLLSKEEALAVELAFWEAAKDSGSHIELEAYLERYPEGAFVELAKARLESLRDPPADLDAANGGSLRGRTHVLEQHQGLWKSRHVPRLSQ